MIVYVYISMGGTKIQSELILVQPILIDYFSNPHGRLQIVGADI